ncbi:MAG: twin-arginine translocase subunit TatC, partial [Hansschlegelia sp.]
MSQADIDATKAPLMDHLIELRSRLIRSILAFAIAFGLCFTVAGHIFNILLVPYEIAAGSAEAIRLQYTAPQEYFITQIKLAMFGAGFISFPIVATQIYKFVAPGLYKNERSAFLPYLVATPLLFLTGAAFVYFVAMPLAMRFFLSMQQAGGDGHASIELIARTSEYLSLIMTLIFAFGICFQTPVVLSLLARAGFIDSAWLVAKRRYAIVVVFAIA